MILSDGATRPVDQMGLYQWHDYLDLIHQLGPRELIRLVRDIETQDPYGHQHPRTKQHDDATLALADLKANDRPRTAPPMQEPAHAST